MEFRSYGHFANGKIAHPVPFNSRKGGEIDVNKGIGVVSVGRWGQAFGLDRVSVIVARNAISGR
jgi:hypothetical protein